MVAARFVVPDTREEWPLGPRRPRALCYTLAGRVVDDRGEPIRGAVVSVPLRPAPDAPTHYRVHTDLDGYYTLYLPEEAYLPHATWNGPETYSRLEVHVDAPGHEATADWIFRGRSLLGRDYKLRRQRAPDGR